MSARTARFTHRIELRDDALAIMAAALGDRARVNHEGEPSHSNLFDNSTGTASNLVTGASRPSRDTIATVGARLAEALGMDAFDEDLVWAGIRATHRIVPIAVRELEAA